MSQYQNTNNLDYDDNRKNTLSEDQLMAYIEGNLNVEDCRRIEEMMSEESAEADAIEGLQQISTKETKRTILDLNRKLHTELLRNKPKRKDKYLNNYWSWIAIVIILILISVGYVVLRIASK